MYYVYILKSLKDNRYYVGMTSDLIKRLKYHNSGRVKSTKNRKPFEVIYSEKYQTREEARKREVYLKSYKGVSDKNKILNKI